MNNFSPNGLGKTSKPKTKFAKSNPNFISNNLLEPVLSDDKKINKLFKLSNKPKYVINFDIYSLNIYDLERCAF
jgi:hypothetical protein